MKVLATADTVGGVWTYALDLARALAPLGVSTTLATMGAPLTEDQWAEARAVPALEIRESGYKLEWMRDPWDDVRAAGDWLMGLAAEVGPDVVHLNTFPHGGLPWRAPVVMVGHSCVVSWWEAVRHEAAPPEWDAYRSVVADGLRAADAVLAPTGAMLAALQRHYGPLPRPAAVYNGRAAEGFAPAEKEDLVLAAGRLWDEAKNLAALAAVAPRLPWPVCVAGEAQHPDGGAAEVGGARPLGRLTPGDLRRWMARAAIYALPARYEPFGLSALEAGLSGCALVLGDIESLREVWGDAAIFVPPDDHGALEAALRGLMRQPAARAALGEKARARALTYTVERMAEGTMAVYRAVTRNEECDS